MCDALKSLTNWETSAGMQLDSREIPCYFPVTRNLGAARILLFWRQLSLPSAFSVSSAAQRLPSRLIA